VVVKAAWKVVTPLELSVPEPSTVTPSSKTTTPVGVPLEDATEAVSVAVWLTVAGLGFNEKVVVVE